MSKQRSTAFQRSSAFYEVSQAASSRLESAAADDEKRRKRLEQKQVEAWRSFVLGRSILSVLAVVLFAFALILIFRLLASSISQEILEVEEERVEREQVFDGSDAAELDTNLPELARSVCSGNIVRKYRSFENIVRKASEVFVRELSSALWMNGKGFNSSIFEAHAASGKAQFIPFVQRKVVAEGSNIVVWGDLHGSSCSLLLALLHQRRAAAGVGDNSARSGSHGACILDDALTLRSDCYFIFLGDTIDRGRHSIEVLYIILTLKLRNPSNVLPFNFYLLCCSFVTMNAHATLPYPLSSTLHIHTHIPTQPHTHTPTHPHIHTSTHPHTHTPTHSASHKRKGMPSHRLVNPMCVGYFNTWKPRRRANECPIWVQTRDMEQIPPSVSTTAPFSGISILSSASCSCLPGCGPRRSQGNFQILWVVLLVSVISYYTRASRLRVELLFLVSCCDSLGLSPSFLLRDMTTSVPSC